MGKKTAERDWGTRLKHGAVQALLILLALMLMIGTVLAQAQPAKKATKRAIAIVFDNSGSMYVGHNMAWCRATYAIEVFASMMNQGDTLQVYPMWPVTVNGKTYTSRNPIEISGGDDTAIIRDMYTPDAGSTPIETLNAAYNGLGTLSADEKWMIVLTDGDIFYENDVPFESKGTTTQAMLSEKLTQYNQTLNVMYLGIGDKAVMPEVSGGTCTYYADKASNSNDVLSKLTSMSNTIFGRDQLQASGEAINFDLSMSKLILFVQGSNIDNIVLKDAQGKTVSSNEGKYQPHYGEKGAGGDYAGSFGVDTQLQGVIVSYDNCDAGTYTLSYSGNATSIGAYYEPDVDLVVQLTDAEGNVVSADAPMYPGTYYLTYGLTDKNGEMSTSALLGTADYHITYAINSEEQTINASEPGQTEIQVAANDQLDLRASVRYLSGYTIEKSGLDLGWPDGGFMILPRPAGSLTASITGGEAQYRLSQLEERGKYRLELNYEGQPLSPEQMKNVSFQAGVDGGNAECVIAQQGGDYILALKYAGCAADTACGDYTVTVRAAYLTEDGLTAQSDPVIIPFSVTDDGYDLSMKLEFGQQFFVLSQIEKAKPIRVLLYKSGEPLTDDELKAVLLSVAADGLKFSAEPLWGQSAYEVRLVTDSAYQSGRYTVNCAASSQDPVGRPIQAEKSDTIELQPYPLWLRILVICLLILLLLTLLLLFLNAKVLPKKIAVGKTIFTVDGMPVTGTAKCTYTGGNKKRGSLEILSPKYSTNPLIKCGVRLELEAISPRKEKSSSRAVLVKSVTPIHGNAINSMKVGSAAFVRDPVSKKFVKAGASGKSPQDFQMANGARCTLGGEFEDGDDGATAISLAAVLKYF